MSTKITAESVIGSSWSRLNDAERKIATTLVGDAGQAHLFESLAGEPPASGKRKLSADRSSDPEIDRLRGVLKHAEELNKKYPGGVVAYVRKARSLLKDKLADKNPFEGFVPHVPPGESMQAGTTEFFDAEKRGLEVAQKTGFVLVAGGLGERLGYSGIKVALPIDLVTGDCYLKRYCQHILALQNAAPNGGKRKLPLFIMTSGDTHDHTVRLLKRNANFGLEDEQITVVPQDKVPALSDNDARFVLNKDGTSLVTKPHGHGDVHLVLHQSGTVQRWRRMGIEWIVFFQDTNGLVFHSVPAALGVSAARQFGMNSITVRRKPGEAVGAICRLENEKKNEAITINVEYSEINALLKATTSPAGDIADASGFSPFPGNINAIVVNMPAYERALNKTEGIIPEFINPKYKDGSRSAFKKPTRLECMMQDLPKLLDSDVRVGFTAFERWMCFSAVKNSLEGGAAKQKKTGFPESAASGETDIYRYYRKVLNGAGVDVNVDGPLVEWTPGIRVASGAKIVVVPTASAASMGAIRAMFVKPDSVRITDRSTLILSGDVTVESLDLDGALRIEAARGTRVRIKSMRCRNKGWTFVKADVNDHSVPEHIRIRGYDIRRDAADIRVFATKERNIVDE